MFHFVQLNKTYENFSPSLGILTTLNCKEILSSLKWRILLSRIHRQWKQHYFYLYAQQDLQFWKQHAAGATIVDQSVNIVPVDDYQQQPEAHVQNSVPASPKGSTFAGGAGTVVNKAEDVVTSMVAKGFILGKDAMNRAKAFDEKHKFTANAAAKVTLLDKKIGLTEKIGMGTAVVNEKVREMDQKFQVSEKTKSAFAAAEQKVNSAGSALLKNKFVFTGAAWVTGAFSKVTKAAEDVGLKTKDTVELAEQQKNDHVSTVRSDSVDDITQVRLSQQSATSNEPAQVSLSSTAEPVTHSSEPRYGCGA